MQQVTAEIAAFTPSEFFHCSHCELLWRQAGMGQKIHAEQRASALPPDLAQTYARIGVLAVDPAGDDAGDRGAGARGKTSQH